MRKRRREVEAGIGEGLESGFGGAVEISEMEFEKYARYKVRPR